LDSEENERVAASGKRALNSSRTSATVLPSKTTSACCSVYWRMGVGIRTGTLIERLLDELKAAPNRSRAKFHARPENPSGRRKGQWRRSSVEQCCRSPCSRYPLFRRRQTRVWECGPAL